MGKLKNIITYTSKLLLSRFKKRDNNIFIFGAWFGNKYDDNPKWLFEYILKNKPNITAYWITPNQTVFEELRKDNLPVLKSESAEALAIVKRAKNYAYCINRNDIGANLTPYLAGCKCFNLWHGVPLKKIGFDNEIIYAGGIPLNQKIYRFIDNLFLGEEYAISTSPTFTKIYTSAFKLNKNHILELGQARNDCFFNHSSFQLKKRFNGKKIIVYMPTHRREGKLAMNLNEILDFKRLDALLNDNNAIFIIKKHYYHREEPTINGYTNILDITREQVHSQELLSDADILVTDYSSCYIDFLLMDKPQIFYCYDLGEYLREDRQMYFQYQDAIGGPLCKTYIELEKVLSEILKGNDNSKKQRDSALQLFYSKENQGCVAEKQISIMLSL